MKIEMDGIQLGKFPSWIPVHPARFRLHHRLQRFWIGQPMLVADWGKPLFFRSSKLSEIGTVSGTKGVNLTPCRCWSNSAWAM